MALVFVNDSTQIIKQKLSTEFVFSLLTLRKLQFRGKLIDNIKLT